MRILLVYDGISKIGGGIDISVLLWMKNLKKLGVTVKLLCHKNSYLQQEKEFSRDLIGAEALDLSSFVPDLHISTLLTPKVRRQIDNFRPDVIHLQHPSPISHQALLFAKDRKIAVLTSYHTTAEKLKHSQLPMSLFVRENGIFNKFIGKSNEVLMKNSDYLAASSKIFQRKLMKYQKKTFYLSPPVSNAFFKPHFSKVKIPRRLVTLSRLSGEKNIGTLISTIDQLRQEYTLSIIGDGPDKKYLKKQVRKLGLSKQVKFLGWVKHQSLPPLLKKYHLFVSASQNFETFGITYIESLASGLPGVVCRDLVSKEVIPQKMAVFISDTDPQNWINKLREFHSQPDLYQKLVGNIKDNYSKLLKYRESESTERLMKAYQTIIKDFYSS